MNRDLIEQRARTIGRICERILNFHDETDEVASMGFRWSYLILRRPKRYLEAFQTSDLRIDQSLLEDALWTHGDEVPGPNGLLAEELAILNEHNNEAAAFMRSHSNTISLLQAGRDL